MVRKIYYIVVSFFLTRVLFLGGGYSYLLEIGKNNSILCGLLGMLLGYFILYLFYKRGINKYVCIFISISVLLVNILSNTILVNTYMLFNTPRIIIMSLFVFGILWASKKEFNLIFRFSLISICLSIPILVMVYSGLFPIVNFINLKPYFDIDIINLIKGSIIFMVNSLLPNLLLLDYKDNLKFKDIGFGYVLGCLSIMYMLFLVIGIYGSEFASIIRFPEYLILKKFNILNFLSNVENILIMVWIFNLLISGWICLKVLRDNLSNKLFYLIIIILFIGIEIFFNRNYVNVLFIRNYIYIVWGILIIWGLLFKKNKN